MRAVVLLNASAGSLSAPEKADRVTRVAETFRQAGIEAEVMPVPSPELEAASREAASSDADVVVLGGGDGTVSSGAAALVGQPKPLGVLPLGTRNHFARDLGIPLELDEAVRTISSGHVREVDVGEVDGRIFLNNCSLGLYPDLVRDRDAQEEREGRGRRGAMFRAAWAALRRFRVRTVTLRMPERVWRLTTPLVFVGNNRYEMSLMSMGRRAALDGGELWLYVARNTSRLGLARLAVHALRGRLEQAEDFESLALPELEMHTRRRHLRLAVDGEVVPMTSPVVYRLRPRALRVLAPPAGT